MANANVNWTDEWTKLEQDLNTPEVDDISGEEMLDADALAAAEEAAKKHKIKMGLMIGGGTLVGVAALLALIKATQKASKKKDAKEGEDDVEIISADDLPTPDGKKVKFDESKGEVVNRDKAVKDIAEQLDVDPEDVRKIVEAAWDASTKYQNSVAADDVADIAAKAEEAMKASKAEANKKAEQAAAEKSRADKNAAKAAKLQKENEDLLKQLEALKKGVKVAEEAEAKEEEIKSDEEKAAERVERQKAEDLAEEMAEDEEAKAFAKAVKKAAKKNKKNK